MNATIRKGLAIYWGFGMSPRLLFTQASHRTRSLGMSCVTVLHTHLLVDVSILVHEPAGHAANLFPRDRAAQFFTARSCKPAAQLADLQEVHAKGALRQNTVAESFK